MTLEASYQSLHFQISDRIGVITFATPERMNAITELRLTELEAILTTVEQDTTLGALILTGGAANAFCVGLDLDLLDRAFNDIPFFESVVRRLNGIITRLEALPIPTIAAVNGYCRAGGFETCMGCDFILMADEAKIGDVHTDAGVLPAVTSLRLKRRIGEQRAKEVIWNARWLDGPEAVRYGLALASYPLADLQTEARNLAASLAAKPRACITSIKGVFQQGIDMSIADGAELELRSFVRYMTEQPYGKEGYQAYRERRVPSWKLAQA